MTDIPSFLDRANRAPPPARPPTLAPLMFADRDGNCQDCHARPVVPYNSRCQECAVRVAKRSTRGEGRE
jgi:hypothetical protein